MLYTDDPNRIKLVKHVSAIYVILFVHVHCIFFLHFEFVYQLQIEKIIIFFIGFKTVCSAVEAKGKKVLG